MRARSILAVLAVVALVAAPAASATTKKKPAPKPVKKYCNLVTDESGDGAWSLNPAVKTGGLDIIGADFASGPKTLVAVLKLSDTDFSPSHDPWASTLIYQYTLGATSNFGQDYEFRAGLSFLTGKVTGTASVGGTGVALKSFTVDRTHNTFTWVLDRTVDKTLTRKGTIFKEFRGQSAANGDSADQAPNQMPHPPTSYPDRAPSCIVAK